MAILILFFLNALVPFVHSLRLREYELAVGTYGAPRRLPVHLVLEFPELDDPIIGRQHLEYARFVINKLYSINFLIQLN